MYGVGGLDDVMFVGAVHGLALLWVEVHAAFLVHCLHYIFTRPISPSLHFIL